MRYCIGVLGFVLFLGACSSKPVCHGKVTSNGKTYVGESSTEKQAQLNACNKYCLENDSQCDAIYQMWLQSPSGQAAGSTKKMDVLFRNQKLMDCVTITCAKKCYAQVQTKELIGAVQCEN